MHEMQLQKSADAVTEGVLALAGWVLDLAWWVLRRPLRLGAAAGLAFLVWRDGWGWAWAAGFYLGLVAVLWRLVAPTSFRRFIAAPLRSGWRGFWIYKCRWRAAMTLCGLSVADRGFVAVPRIERVTSTRSTDYVAVRMLLGQAPTDYERAAPSMAHSFGALSCRVRVASPGRLWLEFLRRDPLTATVPALPIPEYPDLEAVAVGHREDGSPWQAPVLGTHVLIAGVTGSGKGSVVWSLLRGLAPFIHEGLVEVWALDPKGGMELAPGRALFARFAAGDYDEMARMLEDAVVVMRARATRLAGVSRRHEPHQGDPLLLLVVDEVANLTAYLPDRKLKERISQAMSLVLTQGRAVGVNVVAALQDPRKEVLAFRNLFPTKIALRLDEASQVAMVLGDGARDQGARCDEIPDSLPGVGFMRVDGVREPVRVRAAYVTDADIAEMTSRFPAPGSAFGSPAEDQS